MYDMKDPAIKKLVALLVLVAICLGFATYLLLVRAEKQPVAIDQENLRGSEASESTQASLVIANYDKLVDALPAIADTIPNQLLQYHYDHTKKLERKAEIVDEIRQKDDEYSFNLTFSESGTTYTATVTMVNAATQDYRLTVEEKK